MGTNNIGGVYSPPSVNIPEDSIAVKEKSELTVNQNTVKYVIDNACFQQGAVIGKIQEDDYRSSLTHIIPVLFSGYDSKRTSAIIELCDALLLDAINQQKQRDSLEKQAIKQAGLLKDLKYKEADYQIAAAVVGAIVSGAVSVAGGSMAIKGLNPAASGGMTAKGIAGQAITALSHPVGQLFSQPIAAMGTRVQGDAEVVRVLKEILITSMSTRNKVSDDQKALQKKLLEMLIGEFENRKNTTQNLINNMKG